MYMYLSICLNLCSAFPLLSANNHAHSTYLMAWLEMWDQCQGYARHGAHAELTGDVLQEQEMVLLFLGIL